MHLATYFKILISGVSSGQNIVVLRFSEIEVWCHCCTGHLGSLEAMIVLTLLVMKLASGETRLKRSCRASVPHLNQQIFRYTPNRLDVSRHKVVTSPSLSQFGSL